MATSGALWVAAGDGPPSEDSSFIGKAPVQITIAMMPRALDVSDSINGELRSRAH